jgi:FMN-dependent NADH-azoreductase
MEFGDKYLRAVMSFLGITDFESVIVEGMNQFPDEAESIKAKAIERAKQAAKAFAAAKVNV